MIQAKTIPHIYRNKYMRDSAVVVKGSTSSPSSSGGGGGAISGNYLPASKDENGNYVVDLQQVQFKGNIFADGEVSAYGQGGGGTTSSGNTEILDIAYDSRKVTTGSLFVAVTGFVTDGNKYIPMALEKGAAAVLCSRDVGDVPAIMVKECENVTFRDVKIHSQPGMGIVGHLTKNIMIDNLQVVPEVGSVISSNTDATHFTSCSGTITIQNSKFKGQGDDCTNIHGYYYRMYPEGDKKVEIRIEGADLHALSLDYPQIGDTMVVINNKNMSEQGRYLVHSVDTSSVDWKVVIGLDKNIDVESLDNYYMWNYSRFPKVRIYNNSVHSHLARSFLIKSRDVIIAKNCILNSTITAIKLGAELSWRESGPAENVLVEENYITGCGYAAGTSVPSCITLSTEARELPPYLNKNIIIRNNIFDTEKDVAILLKDAENIVIENNMANKKDYVKMENCQNVTIAQ